MFWGSFSLPLVFFVDAVFRGFFFKRQRSGSHRTPLTRTCVAGSFSFCVPPLLSVSPVLAVRPASWWFFGVPFWAPGVFGILLELTGLELARPFRGPFLGTRGGKGFPVLLLPCFLFPLLFCFAATLFLERPAP